jgi:centrosomal protein CEP19
MFKSGATKFGAFSTTTSGFGNDKTSLNTANSTTKPSSSKDSHKVSSNDYVPKRFGLKFDPPTVILEYLIPSSGKLYHHKMKLLKLKGDSDTYEMIDYLKNKHVQYFINNKISESQLKNLIEKLKKRVASGGDSTSTFITTGGLTDSKKENNSAASKLGKLAPMAGNSNKTTKSNTFWESENDNTTASNSKASLNLGSKPSLSSSAGFNKKDDKKSEAKKSGSGNGFWDFEEIELDEDGKDDATPKVDYSSTNLNKLSKAELDKHKQKMDVMFNKNQKKPGDNDFVYDKQEEFDPHEDNEWDEDLELEM